MTEHIELTKAHDVLGFNIFSDRLMAHKQEHHEGIALKERTRPVLNDRQVTYDKSRLQQLRAFSGHLGKGAIGLQDTLCNPAADTINSVTVAQVEAAQRKQDRDPQSTNIMCALVLLMMVLNQIQMDKLKTRSDTTSALDYAAKALAIHATNTANQSIAYADRVDALNKQIAEESQTPLWLTFLTGGLLLFGALATCGAGSALMLGALMTLEQTGVFEKLDNVPGGAWIKLAIVVAIASAGGAIDGALAAGDAGAASAAGAFSNLAKDEAEDGVASAARQSVLSTSASAGVSGILKNTFMGFMQGHGLEYLLEATGVDKKEAQKIDMIVSTIIMAIAIAANLGLFAKFSNGAAASEEIEKLSQKLVDNKDRLSEEFATSMKTKGAYWLSKGVQFFRSSAAFNFVLLLAQMGLNIYKIDQQVHLKQKYEELSAALSALSEPLAMLHMTTFEEQTFSTGAQQQASLAQSQLKTLSTIADDIRAAIRNQTIKGAA